MTKKIYLNENTSSEVFAFFSGKSVDLTSVIDETTKLLTNEHVEWVVSVSNNTVHKIECLWLLAEETGCSLLFEISDDLTERNRAFLDDIIQAKSLKKASSTTQFFHSLSEYICFGVDCIQLFYNRGLAAISKKPVPVANNYKTIALIGVYGLEHVGDIGILGG